jgi:hypothetical protein
MDARVKPAHDELARIHVFAPPDKTWMAGPSPAMTIEGLWQKTCCLKDLPPLAQPRRGSHICVAQAPMRAVQRTGPALWRTNRISLNNEVMPCELLI